MKRIHQSNMEGPETTDSPRKKPKFDPSTHNAHISDAGTEASLMMPPPAIPEVIKDPFRNTIQASQDQLMTDASHDQPNTSDNQFSKEAACGITEFVSPDLLGFTGILKKRYAFTEKFR